MKYELCPICHARVCESAVFRISNDLCGICKDLHSFKRDLEFEKSLKVNTNDYN